MAVGRPIDRVVVDHHRHAVGAQLNVEFDGVGPEADRLPEGGEGVLGRACRGATVGHAQGAVRQGRRQDGRHATR